MHLGQSFDRVHKYIYVQNNWQIDVDRNCFFHNIIADKYVVKIVTWLYTYVCTQMSVTMRYSMQRPIVNFAPRGKL
jgi:hypothetical protein